MNEKLIIEVAKKEGHELEARVNDIFKKNGFVSKQNYKEVDVFAYSSSINYGNSIFVTECKGSSPQDVLLLFAKSKDYIDEQPKGIPLTGAKCRYLPKLRYDETGFNYFDPNLITEDGVMISMMSTHNYPFTMRYCYSGDFRTLPLAKKMPRQDEKNNFFKGMVQVCQGVFNLQNDVKLIIQENPLRYMDIIPLIVTNTQIHIKENGSDQIITADWTIYECPANLERNPMNIQYIFIVNISNLEKFIASFR
jgi:hypothetical protein